MKPQEARNIVEAILFMAPEPLSIERIATLTGFSPEEVNGLISDLEKELANRGVRMQKVAGGYRMITCPEAEKYLIELARGQKRSPLSPAAMEVLAIVAYMQPITRVEVDEIRGVSSESALSTLLDRGLIMEIGRKEAPGRPILFGTTKAFLIYFGLKDLNDLPPLTEFKPPEMAENSEPSSLEE